MKHGKVVLTTFAGRRDRMSLLKRYVDAAIARGLISEWHVWDFCRTEEDRAWLEATFPSLRRTPNDAVYRAAGSAMVGPGGAAMRFLIRAPHDAHVSLVADGGPTYEVVLGGWGNMSTALRVWPAGTAPAHEPDAPAPTPALQCSTPGIMSERTWRAVDLRLIESDAGWQLGLEVDGRKIFAHPIDAPSARRLSLGAMTGYGAAGEWVVPGTAGYAAHRFIPGADGSRRGHWGAFYEHYFRQRAHYADALFLKADDDIVFFDLDRLERFVAFRRAHANPFLVTANVVNNGVCAHLQQQLGIVPEHVMALEMPSEGMHGSLWESGRRAARLHQHFLSDPSAFRREAPESVEIDTRFSINFVAWRGDDLRHFEAQFSADETDLTLTLPRWLGRPHAVHLPFVAAHLSFYSQEREMEAEAILAGYAALADSLGV